MQKRPPVQSLSWRHEWQRLSTHFGFAAGQSVSLLQLCQHSLTLRQMVSAVPQSVGGSPQLSTGAWRQRIGGPPQSPSLSQVFGRSTHARPLSMVQPPLMHASRPEHLPHKPPHPSSPQLFPAQFGVQHWPDGEQTPVWQVPHEPPQPSFPHCLPLHCGAHPHVPLLQAPPVQLPHEPPQPSSPHSLPVHRGKQVWQ